MNNAFLYLIAILYEFAAIQAAFNKNAGLFIYSVAAAVLQLSVISMGK